MRQRAESCWICTAGADSATASATRALRCLRVHADEAPVEVPDQFYGGAESLPQAIAATHARYEGVVDRVMFPNAPPLHVIAQAPGDGSPGQP